MAQGSLAFASEISMVTHTVREVLKQAQHGKCCFCEGSSLARSLRPMSNTIAPKAPYRQNEQSKACVTRLLLAGLLVGQSLLVLSGSATEAIREISSLLRTLLNVLVHMPTT